VVQSLLNQGVNVNVRTISGKTPLMAAAGVNWVVNQTFDEGPDALLAAVKLAHELGRPLRLYTDSQYAIGVLTKGWKVRANTELVAKVRKALDAHPDAKLFHVRGHQGAQLNEHADELAVRAVQSRESTGWVPVSGAGRPLAT